MVMATLAPISKSLPPLPTPKGKKRPKPFGTMIDRTPGIRIPSDSATIPAVSSAPSGTVIAAGKFKATCLQLLDAAAAGETITITKHGKVVARLVPPEAAEDQPFVPLLGMFKGRGKILGDIVSPDFEAWGMEDPRKSKKRKK
jgi:prevent-host-death family protein